MAKVIRDSISLYGDRLTTVEVTFHRFVLAEFNTHRAFSRNSASSRAIPVQKQLDKLAQSTAIPVEWPREQRGMQGGSELEGDAYDDAVNLWTTVEQFVIGAVQAYVEDHPEAEERLHKSVLNRVLEPFMWHTVIVSSTDWENFFSQRCSPLAQPEIRVAAEQIRDAINASEPTSLRLGEWHTPYIQPSEEGLEEGTRLAISAARCARVSYLTHDGVPDIEADKELYKRLITADPPHWSPLEHVATPSFIGNIGNFEGWHQLRHNTEEVIREDA